MSEENPEEPEPAPSEPAPSEPAPSEPAPSEPAPSEPALSEPALSEVAADEELGEALARAIRDSDSGQDRVTVVAEGVAASAEVVGRGPYGCSVRELRVDRPARPQPDAEELARRRQHLEGITVLPEHLRALEVDAAHGEILVRTTPEEVRDRTWFEGVVGPGRARLRRLRYDPETTTRAPQEMPFTYGGLERVVEDLDRALAPAPEPEVDDLAGIPTLSRPPGDRDR